MRPNLIPGPNSTELAIHIGRKRAGWCGLLVAGAAFILPAAVIVGAIAWAYVRFGSMPAASGLLYGVKPVVIAIVIQALWGLGRAAVKGPWLATLAAACVLAVLLGTNELVVLGGAGVIAGTAAWSGGRGIRTPPGTTAGSAVLALAPAGVASVTAGVAATVGLWRLFAVFLKVGAVLFGSGYVLLAFLRADLVVRLHWLTEQQLIDAVAVGQVTPGPVFTTATFVGYVLAGAPGAAAATIGIFLPAFVFVAASAPLIPRLRRSAVTGAVLDGVNVASLALMAVVSWQLARVALVDWATLGLAAVSATLLFRLRINSTWLVLGGALTGLLAYR